MSKIEDLLKEHLKPVRAPQEIDGLIKKMVLEQKIMATWLNTADGCANSTRTSYVAQMRKVETGCKVAVCKYITYDMMEQLTANTANDKVCPYQGRVFRAFQRSELRKLVSAEPEGHYECKKGGIHHE